MYKKYINHYHIFICLIILCGLSPTYADQLNTSTKTPIIRHVQGMKCIGMYLGGTAIGKEGALVGDYYFSPKWKASIGLGGEIGRTNKHCYHTVFLQPLLGFTLYTDHKRWYIRVLSGTKMHMESFYTNKQRYDKEKRNYKANIGLVGGAEIELFLSKHVSVQVSAGLRMFLKKNDLEDRRDAFLNIGFKINL